MLSRALDHVGVFARSLADAALILEVLAGYDADDPDTRPVAAPAFLDTLADDPPMPPQFAFVRTPVWDKAEAGDARRLRSSGARLGERAATVDLPDAYAAAWDDHRVVMSVDMAHNLGAIVERGGEASSKQLRDFSPQGAA